MDTSLPFLLFAILVVGAILFIMIFLTNKGPKKLDTLKYQKSWLEIENSLKKDNPESAQMSVLAGDKLVDQAMRELGIPGNTMGERLKAAKDKWSNAQALWNAHKLRNRIAHEPNVTVSYSEAIRALGAFKKALKNLGAF